MTPQSSDERTPPGNRRQNTRIDISPRREAELAEKRRAWEKRQRELEKHNERKRIFAEKYARNLRMKREREPKSDRHGRSSRSTSRRDCSRSSFPELLPSTSRGVAESVPQGLPLVRAFTNLMGKMLRLENMNELTQQGHRSSHRTGHSMPPRPAYLRYEKHRERSYNRERESRYGDRVPPRREDSKRCLPERPRRRSVTGSPQRVTGRSLSFCLICGNHPQFCKCVREQRRAEDTPRSREIYETRSGEEAGPSSGIRVHRNSDYYRRDFRPRIETVVRYSPPPSLHASSAYQPPPQELGPVHQPLPPQQQFTNRSSAMPIPGPSISTISTIPRRIRILLGMQIIETDEGGPLHLWSQNSKNLQNPTSCPVKLPFSNPNWECLIKYGPMYLPDGSLWIPGPDPEYSYQYDNRAPHRGRGRGRGRGQG